jgi:hypothetical protein
MSLEFRKSYESMSLKFTRSYESMSQVIPMSQVIRAIEKNIKESKLTVSIKYLLQNRNRENDDTLQYLLDPRRCGDG